MQYIKKKYIKPTCNILSTLDFSNVLCSYKSHIFILFCPFMQIA